ncbi:hypothetical protein GJ654_05420 [Rhodoblastus acidophilus]|uniref:Uncharacterized protein n=1 Tax=Rhodoblastus acidophilus TaxID=1074 RepID=A0A6N8DJ46_RHOAC|nr:hypothetical protein [Rhodoblastus acidophilus]MCW2273484.1 hypothetical protein [Rhodoblastus acidophilus]MTV30429.1 hypothetical protein [Rhodoblastus acidophilus]
MLRFARNDGVGGLETPSASVLRVGVDAAKGPGMNGMNGMTAGRGQENCA